MNRLQVCSLNSGSNGNSYYIGTEEVGILIDLGISARMTTQRLAEIGKTPEHIAAIIVSHEHADHIRGIKTFQKKYYTKVITNQKTHTKFRHPILNLEFFDDTPFNVGPFSIQAFTKHHDGIDPYSFIVSYEDYHIGVMTDIGKICDNVTAAVNKCDVLFLESNYDSDMLENGSYPYHLKKRITGGLGHLSNDEAKHLITYHRSQQLEKVFLSHLSNENNTTELCLNTFLDLKLTDIHFEVAPRTGISSVWERKIEKISSLDTAPTNSEQASLF